jgi:hypothetical protein
VHVGSWLGNNANWLAPIGLAAGSAIYGANANSNAAQTQTNALQQAAGLQSAQADRAQNFLEQTYNQGRADQAPYRQAGVNALATLAPQVTGPFQQTPGYQFAFDQGVQALDRSAASRGMLQSGAQQKALTRYGQGVANQEYGNYLQRLQALSGTGQTATAQGAAAGQQYGQSAAGVAQNLGTTLGQNISQQGVVQGQAQTANASALMGGANSLLGYFSSNPGIFK